MDFIPKPGRYFGPNRAIGSLFPIVLFAIIGSIPVPTPGGRDAQEGRALLSTARRAPKSGNTSDIASTKRSKRASIMEGVGSIPGANFRWGDAERQCRPVRNSTGLAPDNHPARDRGRLRGCASDPHRAERRGRIAVIVNHLTVQDPPTKIRSVMV